MAETLKRTVYSEVNAPASRGLQGLAAADGGLAHKRAGPGAGAWPAFEEEALYSYCTWRDSFTLFWVYGLCCILFCCIPPPALPSFYKIRHPFSALVTVQ